VQLSIQTHQPQHGARQKNGHHGQGTAEQTGASVKIVALPPGTRRWNTKKSERAGRVREGSFTRPLNTAERFSVAQQHGAAPFGPPQIHALPQSAKASRAPRCQATGRWMHRSGKQPSQTVARCPWFRRRVTSVALGADANRQNVPTQGPIPPRTRDKFCQARSRETKCKQGRRGRIAPWEKKTPGKHQHPRGRGV